MGFLKKFILISFAFVLVILFAPGIPPNLNFQPYTLTPPMPLEGKLARNTILDKAELIKIDKPIVGPESIAIRGDEIYTGTIGGELIRIKNGKVKTITRIGKTCDGLWDIKNCGRIFGVRFGPDKKLYAADASFGIFKIDVDTGVKEHLVKMDKPIEGIYPQIGDDVDISKDGTVYWTDATTNTDCDAFFMEPMGVASGRLIKYDPKTKKNTVLINGINFANGLTLSKDEDFVLVSETFMGRVRRYHLKGEKKGQSDIFIDGLPGLPDNPRTNGKDGFYIALVSPRIPSEPSLVDVVEGLGPRPLVRKFIVRVHFIITRILRYIESFFPSPVFREWIVYISNGGIAGDPNYLPYKAIVIETDKDGNVIGSLQNERGPVTVVSEITVEKDYAYIGSPFLTGVYRLERELLEQYDSSKT